MVSEHAHAGSDIYTDGSGAKESVHGSLRGSKRCWVYLGMVPHMKVRLFRETQNGNTNNSRTRWGGTHTRTEIISDCNQDYTGQLSGVAAYDILQRMDLQSLFCQPQEMSWMWSWSQSLTPRPCHLLRVTRPCPATRRMPHHEFGTAIPSGLILPFFNNGVALWTFLV